MRSPRDAIAGAIPAARRRCAAVAVASERNILLGTILLASAVSVVTGFVLAQYYSIDIISSLVFVPEDCYLDWGTKVGRHCFSDYAMPVTFGMRPNPWAGFPMQTHEGIKLAYNNYLAAGMLPQLAFGLLGKWLGAPGLGLVGYQFVLTLACLTPAAWAARGACGLERIVVFIACGVAAVPAWMMIDRGNSAGFVVPVALVFLVALCRRRWGLVTTMVILAALVKPQFAVLGVALFAARRLRWAGTAVAGVIISNLVAYALWPRDFPETIAQSIRNMLGYGGGGGGTSQAVVAGFNVSFAKGLLAIPDGIKAAETGGMVPDGFLAGPRSMIGYAILVVVVLAILVLGRRIPPVMVGVVLLATASLFPALSQPYYLVFVLPVAALVVRDPDGPPGTGIFDRPETVGAPRRAVGVCVSLAAALCIAQIALPSLPTHAGDIAGQVGSTAITDARLVTATTIFFAPLLWLLTCGFILASYTRRRAPSSAMDGVPAQESPTAAPLPATEFTTKRKTQFSPHEPT